MRIQILELPTQYVGENASTPFALVFDQCDELTSVEGHSAFGRMVGAVGVFVTPETVEVA